MQINSFLTENPLGFHYYLHFTYGEAVVPRGKGTCPGHRAPRLQRTFKPQAPSCRAHVLCSLDTAAPGKQGHTAQGPPPTQAPLVPPAGLLRLEDLPGPHGPRGSPPGPSQAPSICAVAPLGFWAHFEKPFWLEHFM